MKEKERIKVLLTGAGVTHQYGGPLAKDIWEFIYNQSEIKQSSKLLEQLQNTSNDFEEAYETIINDNDENDKRIILNAIETAYLIVDESYREVSIDNIFDFFVLFLNQNKSIFFTLNQDLFVERKFYLFYEESGTYDNRIRLQNKGIIKNETDIIRLKRLGYDFGNIKQHGLEFQNDWKEEYRNEMLNEVDTSYGAWGKEGKICPYVKLHGSMDLYEKENKLSIMLIGKNKQNDMSKFDLLNKYFEVFKNVLNGNQCDILVIGYSFGDKYINKEIFDSIEKHDSKLYIVIKEPLDDFKNVVGKPEYEKIKSNLLGYYSSGLNRRTIDLLTNNYLEDIN